MIDKAETIKSNRHTGIHCHTGCFTAAKVSLTPMMRLCCAKALLTRWASSNFVEFVQSRSGVKVEQSESAPKIRFRIQMAAFVRRKKGLQ